jgi:hypothetical protein
MMSMIMTVGLPLATKWVEEEQQRILAEGIPLTPHQAFDAHLVGVKDLKKVRLLKVDFIPLPSNPILRRMNDSVGLVSPVTAGITLGMESISEMIFGAIVRSSRMNSYT